MKKSLIILLIISLLLITTNVFAEIKRTYFIKHWIGCVSIAFLEKEGDYIQHIDLKNSRKVYFTDEPLGYIEEIIKEKWYDDTTIKIYLPKNRNLK